MRREEFRSGGCVALGAADPSLVKLPLCADLARPPLPRTDNITLGTACGKMYRTSVLSITDIGDSDIMRSIPESAP